MSVPTIEREDGGPDDIRCDDCGTVYPFASLNPIQSFGERVSAGGEVPAGECPDDDCGALCYAVVPAAATEFTVDAKANAITELIDLLPLTQAQRVEARTAIGAAVEALIDECRSYYRAR